MPKTVLVVDDDPIFRAFAAEMLARFGFAVDELEDGAGVGAYLRRQTPILVVVDILMPNKDGLEVIREIKRDHPAVKILAVSSGGRIKSEDLLHWAKLSGADVTMTKPLEDERMLRAMAEALGAVTAGLA